MSQGGVCRCLLCTPQCLYRSPWPNLRGHHPVLLSGCWPCAQQGPSLHPPVCNTHIWPPFLQVLALYAADGNWYNAVVEGVAGIHLIVSYEGYVEKEEVSPTLSLSLHQLKRRQS